MRLPFIPGTHCVGGGLGDRAGLNVGAANYLSLPGIESQISQPIAQSIYRLPHPYFFNEYTARMS